MTMKMIMISNDSSWGVMMCTGLLCPNVVCGGCQDESALNATTVYITLDATSWDITDYHWWSLVIIGYHWLSLTIIDYHWQDESALNAMQIPCT